MTPTARSRTGAGARITAICLATSLSMLPATAREAESTEADARRAVSAAWRDHIDAAKRKDAKAVVEIYADDVVYVVPGVADVRGRSAIDRMEAETLAANDVLDAVHTIESLEVFGDVAYEIGTVVGPVRAKGEEVQTVTFHFMALWRRQADGAWRIQHIVGEPEAPAETPGN